MANRLKYKMYSLVIRQLNPIQKGIQTTHAVVEYAKLYSDNECYKFWSNEDKTLVMLDVNGTLEMKEIIQKLVSLGIKFACFCEPDLDGLITSICFLADERVWDSFWQSDHLLPCYDSTMMFGDVTIDDSDETTKMIVGLRKILEHLHTSR